MSRPLFLRARRRGIALVVTLSIIVLVTIAVVAFFSRATANRSTEASRTNQVLSQQLAATAIDYVSGTFLKEIIDPTNSTVYPGTNGNSIYQPKAAQNYIPDPNKVPSFAAGGNSTYSTLIRQSIPSSDNNASADATTSAASNGRVVTADRWNSPKLTTANFTPSQVPNWIYVLRDGTVTGSISSTSASKVIGRFAYNVYDTGGLLDVTVQSFPVGLSADARQTIKGRIPGADLSVLSGATVSSLIDWRNPSSKGNYVALTKDAARKGFLQPIPGDNSINTRQDLIRLASAGVYGISPSTLPYLTHFSRSVNGPGFSPKNPADPAFNPSNGYDYAGKANDPASANRFIPNVRVTVSFTRADGSTAMVGEPLIKSRFALSRLGGLGMNGVETSGNTTINAGQPSPADAVTVRRDFGLVWDASGQEGTPNVWRYVGSTGNNLQATIKTLAQVAAEGREPNFFELLKAALLSGSLGQGPADPDGSAGMGPNPTYARGSNNSSRLPRLADYQIIQIGANIIDQADTDNIPTAIQFDPDQLAVPLPVPVPPTSYTTTRIDPLVGIENLPYINKLFTRFFRPSANYSMGAFNQPAYRSWLRGWLCFELWNPHTNALNPSNMSMRIVPKKGYMQFLSSSRRGELNSNSVPVKGAYSGDQRFSTPRLQPNLQTISFQTGTQKFKDPLVLSTNATEGSANCTMPQGNYDDTNPNVNLKWVGFWIGDLDEPDGSIPGTPLASDEKVSFTAPAGYQIGPSPSFDFTLQLEVETSSGSGDWRPVQRLYGPNHQARLGVQSFYYFRNSTNYTLPTETTTSVGSHPLTFADPRTNRFGMSVINNAGLDKSTNAWENKTLRSGSNNNTLFNIGRFLRAAGSTPSAALGSSWYAEGAGWQIASLCENESTSSAKAADLDSVLRQGDGKNANATGSFNPLNVGPNAQLGRPVLLNRPFRSVGELGVVFRDQPWKTLDFSSTNSADAALLDLFSVEEEASLVAGKINLNSARAETLSAFVVQTDRVANTPGATIISSNVATTIANGIKSKLQSDGPMSNVGDLVKYLDGQSTLGIDGAIKSRREAAIRALAGVGQVRTWNFLVDVVAQTGRFSSGTSATNFVVEGESRQWASLAIDRLAGKVVAEQTEVVSE